MINRRYILKEGEYKNGQPKHTGNIEHARHWKNTIKKMRAQMLAKSIQLGYKKSST